MYGYSLPEEGVPIELINVRLQAIGLTDKPSMPEEPAVAEDPAAALKTERPVYLPEAREFRVVPVYDGHRTRHGQRITGPALIEQVNTTLLLTSSFDCVCDSHGSFVVRRIKRGCPRPATLQEVVP